MEKVLIIYATNHGHSSKTAERLGALLEQQELSAEVVEVQKNGSQDPARFDAVIVMASIHIGRHQAKMAKWVKANAETLNSMPTAFLSVSLSAGSGIPEILDENREQAQAFADDTGWTPGAIEPVGGALQYPSYGFVNRFIMKRIAKRQGLPLDTSREYEYTDWEALEEFSERFAHGVEAGF